MYLLRSIDHACHYIHQVKHNNKWFHFNDKQFSKTNLLISSKEIYLLFYSEAHWYNNSVQLIKLFYTCLGGDKQCMFLFLSGVAFDL